MKKRDLLIILCALLAAGVLLLLSRLLPSGQTVMVTIDGEEVLQKPLDADGEYEIRQQDGSLNVIAVEDGAVRMLEANCRDGLCIRQGVMTSAAKTIVCLPHRLVVRLSGETGSTQEEELDVMIR